METQKPRMTMAAVTRGKAEAPIRVVLYGTEGVGKSTWAADAPAPIFLPVEQGTRHLNVARFPRLRSWGDLIDALDSLENEPHECKTAIIDTLDALEPIVWDRTCQSRLADGGKKVSNIEEYGFAKGYVYALDLWRELVERLDRLSEKRGMGVVLIAHAALVTVKSPDTEDFGRFDLKIHHKASALLREWADHVLFASTEVALRKVNNRTKVIGLGDRVLHTTSAPGWVAKSRGNVPPVLPLSFEAWSSALRGDDVTVDTVMARIDAMLPHVAPAKIDAVTATIKKAVASSDPVAALATVANRLSVTIAKEAA